MQVRGHAGRPGSAEMHATGDFLTGPELRAINVLCANFAEFGRKRGLETARAGDKPVEKESSGHGAVLVGEIEGDIVRGGGEANGLYALWRGASTKTPVSRKSTPAFTTQTTTALTPLPSPY